MNPREELLIEAMTEIRRIANDSGNHRFMIAKIYDIATQAVRLEPDGVAQRPLQNRDEMLRGLAAFFRESVHHVWSNDEIADCLIDMVSEATLTSTVRHDVEKTEDGTS